MPIPLIFISSTFLEFDVEREQLQRLLTKILPVGCNLSEVLASDSRDLESNLKNQIDKADILILLLGIRYGSQKGKISWTEREVRHAYERGKKIFPYMKKQKPPSRALELDRKKQKALEKLIQFVQKEVSPNIPRYSDMVELGMLVVRDVLYEIERLNQLARDENTD